MYNLLIFKEESLGGGGGGTLTVPTSHSVSSTQDVFDKFKKQTGIDLKAIYEEDPSAELDDVFNYDMKMYILSASTNQFLLDSSFFFTVGELIKGINECFSAPLN